MEYIEVTGADVDPIKEPLKRSYIHSPSNQAITSDTLYDLMRDLKDSEQEAFVFMNPDATRQGSLTFKRWVALSENVAVSLADLGVKTHDRVGVIIPNCEELVVAFGGMLHCAALPVFLTYDLKSGKDIKVKIKDTEISVIIVHIGDEEQRNLVLKLFEKILNGECDDEIPALKHVIVISDDIPKGAINFSELLKEKGDEEKQEVLSRNANIYLDDPVWIGLTSGSTGKPKYCPISNRCIIQAARCFGVRMGLGKGTIFFNDRPMSWAGGAISYVFALATKHTIVTIDAKQTVKNSGPENILKLIENEKVSAALFMPYLMYDILNMEPEKREKYDTSSLKLVLTGGQRIDPVLIEKIKSMLRVGVAIGYGSTEGGFISLMFPHADFIKQHVTVGYPAATVEVSIRDQDNNIVPINTQGEICTRGPNVFHGYFKDEEKTKETIDQYGWLHTGDIGTMTPYGYITIVGRLKEFIKRGTVIVQPGTIEITLLEHPKIHQVQVVGVPDPRLYEELCACIQVKDGETLTEAEMKEWCKEVFGDFTADGLNNAPRYFLMLDDIPTLMNGKIDRGSLKKIATEKFGQ